jgi:hemin uptake protein HemP
MRIILNYSPNLLNKRMSDGHDQRKRTRPPRRNQVPRTSSRRLLAGHRQLLIEHDGAVYSLKLTRLGKLILTK